jgi:hypothetical protein
VSWNDVLFRQNHPISAKLSTLSTQHLFLTRRLPPGEWRESKYIALRVNTLKSRPDSISFKRGHFMQLYEGQTRANQMLGRGSFVILFCGGQLT